VVCPIGVITKPCKGKPCPGIGPQLHRKKTKDTNFKKGGNKLGLHRDFTKIQTT